jgi:hypothetical protein
MIPVYQSLLTDKKKKIQGDCLRACICSLLHLPIKDIPHFIEHKTRKGHTWIDFLEEWLKTKGYKLFFDKDIPNTEFYMVWGTSPRGSYHSVIHSVGKLVHDPHPNGGDVIPSQYVWLEEIRKSRWRVNLKRKEGNLK